MAALRIFACSRLSAILRYHVNNAGTSRIVPTVLSQVQFISLSLSHDTNSDTLVTCGFFTGVKYLSLTHSEAVCLRASLHRETNIPMFSTVRLVAFQSPCGDRSMPFYHLLRSLSYVFLINFTSCLMMCPNHFYITF